ncbi:MAG: winged helix-turn-helix domain-containing protein [Paraburkholderia sp.]
MRILCVGAGERVEYLVAALREANHSVSSIERVVDAAYLVGAEQIDAVIALTLGDPVEAVRAMIARPEHTVLVIIDTPGDQDARIAALYAGADVCFTGHYEYAELEARLHALWRECSWTDADTGRTAALSAAGMTLSRATRSLISPDGAMLALTRREYLLMERLLRHAGTVVQRDDLLAYVFEDGDADAVSLQRLVSTLRRRIPESGWRLRLDTVPRVGYRVVFNGEGA